MFVYNSHTQPAAAPSAGKVVYTEVNSETKVKKTQDLVCATCTCMGKVGSINVNKGVLFLVCEHLLMTHG